MKNKFNYNFLQNYIQLKLGYITRSFVNSKKVKAFFASFRFSCDPMLGIGKPATYIK